MTNKQNNENFKLIFGIIYASIIVLMILFFNFDNIDKYLYENKETKINTNDNTKYINTDDNDNDNNKQNNNDINSIEYVNDEEKIKEEKTISLDRALELLYNNEKNDNVEIYEKDIDTHIRIIKNVSFSGTYSSMDFDSFYINNVNTKNKTYNNVRIRIPAVGENNESINNSNIDNLRIGDKVEVLCSIANGLDFVDKSMKDSVRNKYDDFEIYYPMYSNVNYKKLVIKTNRDAEDELMEKYSDKEKIYDLNEFYDDLTIVSNENLKRSDKIFRGIKFKIKAKCVKKFNVYDHYYLEYEIKNDNKIINDDNLKINSQYNYIGEDDNGEDKYYLTKSHFSLPIEKFLDDKDEYKYKDYKKEQAIILENKEIKKGYQDFIFKYTTTYTSRINLVIIKEEDLNASLDEGAPSGVTSPSAIRRGELASPSKELSSDETLNTIKKIGIDTDIDIADRVLFGKNLYWDVVDIDYKDKNKILIMLTNDSVEENIPKMRWTTKESASYKDSDVRKYLNEEFLYKYFTGDDINRMYITTLDIVINNVNGNTIYDTVSDKIFILSDDDIDEYKWTLTDPISTSFVRNQRYGLKRASMYRRNKRINDEFDQDTNGMSETWSVYPLVWININ